jgi:hypothetical protein
MRRGDGYATLQESYAPNSARARLPEGGRRLGVVCALHRRGAAPTAETARSCQTTPDALRPTRRSLPIQLARNYDHDNATPLTRRTTSSQTSFRLAML